MKQTTTEQVGDYVIEFRPGHAMPYGVRTAGDEEFISLHSGKRSARDAVTRYQTTDKRRQQYND